MKMFRWLFVDLLGPKGTLLLVLVLLVGGPAVLFWFQNAETRVDLVLRLTPDMGWYLAQNAPVPALIGVGLAIGFVIPVFFFSVAQVQKGRQIKVLKRQVTALQDELGLARQAAERRAAAAEASVAKQDTSTESEGGGDDKPSPVDTGNFDDLI
ncbi:MAG TPA: hypothetical protein DIU15_15910 [Deltaproteobacteria bacterium]|nr:hypothetical protein [Deltaproteobacteria bacterium]HCP47527.1 hypothetical protein [Deltaproteobacteria bacterium]